MADFRGRFELLPVSGRHGAEAGRMLQPVKMKRQVEITKAGSKRKTFLNGCSPIIGSLILFDMQVNTFKRI